MNAAHTSQKRFGRQRHETFDVSIAARRHPARVFASTAAIFVNDNDGDDNGPSPRPAAKRGEITAEFCHVESREKSGVGLPLTF